MLDREPIRIHVGLTSLGVVAISLAIDVLSDVDVKAAAARALTSLVVLLGGSELARSKVTPTEPLVEDLASFTNRPPSTVRAELDLASGDAGKRPLARRRAARRHPSKP